MDTYKLARNYVLKRKFKMVEDTGENLIFRYQFENIHICEDQQGEDFLMIVLPVLNNITDENYNEVVKCCNEINAELKHVKIYVVKNLLMIASEIFYKGKKDLEYQMNRTLSSMIVAKDRFEKKVFSIKV